MSCYYGEGSDRMATVTLDWWDVPQRARVLTVKDHRDCVIVFVEVVSTSYPWRTWLTESRVSYDA